MSHTQGPWSRRDGGAFQREVVITTYQRDREVFGPICELDTDFSGDIGEEQKANARLIAAAPDLLEALKTVVANAPEPYCAITRAIDAQCRAAIAKATGEQK